ncbi:MAG: hypoxanthine phosphoribosyltransferase [Nitrospirota bacterium]|nr:hypoxanthine phosphoribosyltransferase [Nitrospirota bacterium]
MQLKEMITADEIASIVRRMGTEISRDYEGKELLVVCVLKGSAIFFADLVRRLTCTTEMDFVRLTSYGANVTSSGNVVMTKDLDSCIEGRHVLIVEDIIETGHTTRFLVDLLANRRPASLKICTLLKKNVPEKPEIVVDYLGTAIEDRFVVGYGLDLNEKFRNLPSVCFLEK